MLYKTERKFVLFSVSASPIVLAYFNSLFFPLFSVVVDAQCAYKIHLNNNPSYHPPHACVYVCLCLQLSGVLVHQTPCYQIHKKNMMPRQNYFNKYCHGAKIRGIYIFRRTRVIDFFL